uniref:Kelch-like protein 11-like n=1 Tax=Saccoglossus kowalevskii TaxID=10224 RepID=A0ABM0M259_SACKO|nr:PREDICTED: kelch-like protein 11-like [Saccoglossus kowalevskii]
MANDEKRYLRVSSGVLSHLNDQRKNKVLCDMTIVVDGHDFNAHKCVLAASSPYFESLFRSNMKESQTGKVELQCTSAEGMEAILSYMYTVDVTLTMDIIDVVVSGADHLLLTELKKVCEVYIIDHLTTSNCLWALNLADLYNLSQWVHEKASRVLMRQFSKVLQDEQNEALLMELSAHRIYNILSDGRLTDRKEEDLFEFLVKWVRHSQKERKATLSKLMSKLHLETVNKQYLVSRIKKEPLVRCNRDCRMYVRQAMKYNVLSDRTICSVPLKAHPGRLVDVVVVACSYCIFGYVLDENRWIHLRDWDEKWPLSYKAVKRGNQLLFLTKRTKPLIGTDYLYDPLTDTWLKYSGTQHEYNSSWLQKSPLQMEGVQLQHMVVTANGQIYAIYFDDENFIVWNVIKEDNAWLFVVADDGHVSTKQFVNTCGNPCITIETPDGIEVEIPGNRKVVISNEPNQGVFTRDSSLPQIPIARSNAGICNINGDIFVCGGICHTKSESGLIFHEFVSSVCIFDSAKQIWRDLTRMPVNTWVLGCGLFQLPYEYTQ